MIGPGEEIIYTPGVAGGKATVAHPDGGCGREFSVKIIYHATASRFHVTAYTPEHAAEVAQRLAGKSTRYGIPMAYHVVDTQSGKLTPIIIDPAIRAAAQRMRML